MSIEEILDVAVIGADSKYYEVLKRAGIHGLIAAKTYLQVQPTTNLAVLESSGEVGGTWTPSRVYPMLRTNNQVGCFNAGDFPMREELFGVKPGQHIPGLTMHKYLVEYAKHFGVFERIRCNSKATVAECRDNDGWLLTITSTIDGTEKKVLAKKLIVATGLCSEPFVPNITGSAEFEGPIYHNKELAKRDEELKKMSDIVVLGGSKSAYDAAYAYAMRDIKVHLVIRESGSGPMWMMPALVTPLKRLLEGLVSTRLLTWFSPCVWGDADGYSWIRWFLNATVLGRLVGSLYWNILTGDVKRSLSLEKNPETAKLQPSIAPYWHATGICILNYEHDFYGLVRDRKIEVHISDIDRLSKNTVHLANGDELRADAIVAATGWSNTPPLTFLPASIETSLGLPSYGTVPSKDLELSKLADAEILDRFPALKAQPLPTVSPKQAASSEASSNGTEKQEPSRPWRLFRFAVPPAFIHKRTIAFTGFHFSLRTSTTAELEALWIAAFMTGALDPATCLGHFSCTKSKQFASQDIDARVLWDTMLMTQDMRWRHGAVGYGDRNPDLAFDTLPFMDLLAGDLGLKKRRKGGWREWLEGYICKDHAGIVDEWFTLQRKSK
ncbi:MAG: hypothetical protein M1820_006168 [Bogoriella megaspora]|nr:MAG: hypothetical protein M1820_006168 [Bogoriella megaspora]